MKKISELLRSKELLKVRIEEREEVKNKEDKENNEIEKNIWEEQKKLNEKEREEKNKVALKYKSLKEDIEKNIETLKNDKKELDKIFKLYEIKNNIVEDFTIYDIKTKEVYNIIDTIYNTDSLILKAFIIKDKDKPKNFYSLSVYGNSIYNSDIIFKRFKGVFGISKRTSSGNWSLTIDDNIKNFDTEEKALLYFEKNKSKILERYIEYFEIEKLLQEVKSLNEEDIREGFLNYKKDWFLSNYNNYSLINGENQDYNNILKEILKYNKKEELKK